MSVDKPSLSDFFNMLSEEKSKPLEPIEKVSFEDFFKAIAAAKTPDLVEEKVEIITPAETVIEEAKIELSEAPLGLFGGDPDQKVDDFLSPLNRNFVTHDELQKHYKTFIARVQHQLSTVGGGGETKLRRLDDIDRSSIADNKFLKYDAASGKFKFAPVVTGDIVTTHLYATTLVTTGSYTATEEDHYIGVNYTGVCTITLPSSVTNGEMLIIKDESGNASINPIKVLGNVDNDPGGFTLGIDNGSISLIYRNGWRII
jgi:hypothetical protein